MSGRKTIAIIGGGFTGLAAAYELAKRGFDITLFERGAFLGGLASGFTIHGHPLEKAYHHLFTSDTYMIDMVKELALSDELLVCKDSKAIYSDGTLYPFTTPRDLIHFTPLRFFDRIRFGLATLYLMKTKKWERLVPVSATRWLKKWYGTQGYRVIWEPILKGKFHDYYDTVSMAWLWARIHVRGNSKDGDTESVLYFKHGFQTVVNALQKKIETLGVTVQYHAEIIGIKSSDSAAIIELADGTTKTFDRIICTTPTHVFAKLIEKNTHCTNEYLEHLNSIQYLGALLIVFSSPQSLSRYYWHNLSDPNAPFLVFLQHTNLINAERYQNNHVYYLGAYLPHEHAFFHSEQAYVIREGLAYVKRLFPAFDVDAIKETHLFRFQNAQQVVDTEYLQKIPDYKTPIPGVYLSNFSQIFPEDRGTNFAVREGVTVAKIVRESL